MSCHGVEFRGRCFPIYLYEVDWKIPEPEPGPHPDPWQELLSDLTILVNIHRVAKQIANQEIRERLLDNTIGFAKSMNWPDDVKLGDGLFQGEKAFMAAE